MKKLNYRLVKETGFKGTLNTKDTKLEGFKFNPKNEVIYDGVTVNEMLIVNPSFIENVLKRKIKRKLELYLKFVINLIDDESGSTDDDLHMALDGLVRYKGIVENRYRKFIDERYLKAFLKKEQLLEQELKNKIIRYNYQQHIKESNKKSR